MDINPRWAYFILTIPFIFVWAALFLLSKNTRREQLIMSLFVIPVGIMSEAFLYFKDYWIPGSILSINISGVPVYFEDLIFSFAIGGIGGVIYETIFYKKLFRLKTATIHKKLWIVFILILAGFIAYILFNFGVNSIFATSVGMIAAALLIVSQRKDLLANSLISGVAVMLIMFISYIILYNLVRNTEKLLEQGWLLYNTPLDIRIFNIPLTELVWGFSWGMLGGPIYEFWKDLRKN